jgi:hypothetical protein
MIDNASIKMGMRPVICVAHGGNPFYMIKRFHEVELRAKLLDNWPSPYFKYLTTS